MRIAREADDINLGIPAKERTDQAAHGGRVINNDDANGCHVLEASVRR
jgi:hypothetical protein